MPAPWRMATSAPSTTESEPRSVTTWCQRAPKLSWSACSSTRLSTGTHHRNSSALLRSRSQAPTSTPCATPSSSSTDTWILIRRHGNRSWKTHSSLRFMVMSYNATMALSHIQVKPSRMSHAWKAISRKGVGRRPRNSHIRVEPVTVTRFSHVPALNFVNIISARLVREGLLREGVTVE